MSELLMSSHNFPCILFTEIMKIPFFSYEKVKLALVSHSELMHEKMKIFQIICVILEFHILAEGMSS